MDFNKIISGKQPALVSFGAEWCEPCKWLEPILKEIEDAFAGELTVHKIDIDKEPALKETYHIRSVPTLLLFKDNDIRWRYQGFDTAPKMKKIIREKLDN
jgi:thioredoxin 1